MKRMITSIYAQYAVSVIFAGVGYCLIDIVLGYKLKFQEALLFGVVIGFVVLLTEVKQWNVFSWQYILSIVAAIVIFSELKRIMFGIPWRKNAENN